MARGRSTPYPAQLERFLARLNGDRRTFSAAALEKEFTHPQHQKLGTTIGGIHKALMRAFADGKIISFVDDQGSVLRESEVVVPGSKAISQPQIFATEGTPSPEESYRAVTYEELTHHDVVDASEEKAVASDKEEDASDGAHAPGRDELATDAADRDDAEDDSPPGLELSPEEAGSLYQQYLSEMPESVPEWVPLSVLRVWATTALVVANLRRMVRSGPTNERLALIRAGLARKGDTSPGSQAARGIAQLCRRPGIFWGEVFRGANKHYLDEGVGIDANQLAEFGADPVLYYLENEHSPFVLLLCGVALNINPELLEELAEVCDDEAGALTADDESEQADDRIAQLESMLDDARKALKDAAKEVKAASKHSEALEETLKRARESAQRESGKELVAEQKARQEAEDSLSRAKAELEEVQEDAKRAQELDAEVEALQRSRDALLLEERSLDKERRLRDEIEVQLQDQMRQLGELRAQLRAQNETLLPTADGFSLLQGLSRPAGEAARLAGERLAEGRSLPGDDQLLSFVGTVMKTAEAMQVAAPVPSGDGEGAPQVAESEAADELVAPTAADDAAVDAVAKTGVADEAKLTDDEPDIEKPAAPSRRRRRSGTWFTVRPEGGAGEIGGSAILIETQNHHRVLLDAGQRVKGEYGQDTTHLFHRGLRGVDHLHGILLSHAHIDHVGSLPPLWSFHSAQQDSEVPIWMTAPTKDLAEIMLKDSAKIQHAREYERDALAESDFGESMDPVYTEADVNEVLGVAQTADAYAPVPIPGTSLVAQFLPVSHVLGSCAIHLRDTESGHTLLYTGDLGPISQPQLTLPDFGGTQLIQHAETIIMESTYGVLKDHEREGRKRSGMDGREREISVLFDNAERALERGGFVLMPSFSLGRTQELVRLIGDRMKNPKIYIAGMGETIFEVYDRYQRRDKGSWVRPGEYPDTDPIGRRMRGRSIEERVEDVLAGASGFIIASPAMLSGGWSRAFMERMVSDERHAIIFSGYLPRHGTNIPRLRELGKNRPLRIGDEQVRIRCDWLKVGLSAHAGALDLRLFAREMSAGEDHVNFGLVHGEPQSQRELATDIDASENAAAKVLSNGEPWVPSRP
jgi:Cft2 family RNA processing exonuclease